MPFRPPHPCKVPGCAGLTHSKYCSKHSYLEKQEERAYNAQREGSIKKLYYSAEWRKTRDAFLIANPFCAVCRKNGKLVKADHVHHIVALREGGTNDESNLVSLCRGCHTQVHGHKGDYKKKYKVYTYDNT